MLLLDYDEPHTSILSQGPPQTSKSTRQFTTLPVHLSQLNQYRNQSCNTIEHGGNVVKNLSDANKVFQTLKSEKSHKNAFVELADQLKDILRKIRFPANIKSRE